MHISIIQEPSGDIYFETGSHYRSVKLESMDRRAFHRDWNLRASGYSSMNTEINTLMSLNQLRELRDALNKFLPQRLNEG